MLNIGVLVSGNGSNLEAIIEGIEREKIPAKVRMIISDKENAYALKRAENHNIEAAFIDPKKFGTKEEFEKEIIRHFEKQEISLICLAGFLRILSPLFIKHYPLRIMNIHPALLPAFPGLDVQKKALEYGAKFSGCTVHFVDTGVDTGPIIFQAVVPIEDQDTPESLSKKILKEEHKIYIKAIKAFAEGKLTVKGRKVFLQEE